MASVGWVASHTGLPSFRLEGTTAGALSTMAATDGVRSWSVKVTGNGGTLLFSDPLAQPGMETTYKWGKSTWKITRPVPNGDEWWRGMVSRSDGRTIPDLVWETNNDPRSWNAPISRFSSRIARWKIEDEAITGDGVFVLLDPTRGQDVWGLLTTHEPLIVMPGAPAESLPPRVITVDKVASSRITGDGWLEFSVSWAEVPLDSPMLSRKGVSWTSGAPVVTWGEWDAYEGAWANRTYAELCTLIAGMPS